jgi:ParB family chromosome partitioning protein
MNISPADVIINRNRRIRKEVTPEAIATLADSISRLGLINPITLNKDNELIAGETRLRAVMSLGWTSIPFRRFEDLSEEDQLSIELEENMKRTDLPWQDQCDALHRFHQLKKATNPAWREEDTADAVGYSRSKISKSLLVAREALVPGDQSILGIKKYSVAVGRVARQVERRKADELAAVTPFEDAHPQRTDPFECADFLSWTEKYEGPPFNLIHCDFPYGINADKFNQGASEAYGGYNDKPETYFNLLNCLVQNKEKLLGASGHIIFWFSMRYYFETLQILREHFWVDPYPLIWVKSDGKGTLPDPQRGPRRVYEVAFLCSHGDRKILFAVANSFVAPTERSGEHMSEKSQIMLEHFFRMIVDDKTKILDPTCGSGSALRAARALGATNLLGLELNPQFVDGARRAWTSQ